MITRRGVLGVMAGAAVPTVAAALDAGAASLTEACRRALPGGTRGPVFGAIEGGYRVLLDELVRRSGLRWVQTAVRHIAADGPGWVLRGDEGSSWRADAVIVAVPAPQLPGLVGDIAPRAASIAATTLTRAAFGAQTEAIASRLIRSMSASNWLLIAAGALATFNMAIGGDAVRAQIFTLVGGGRRRVVRGEALLPELGDDQRRVRNTASR